MTHAQLSLKMHQQHPYIDLGAMGLAGLNFILATISLNDLNLIAAFTGVAVTILVNIHRMVYAVLWIVELKRAGWRLPKHEPSAPAEPNPEKPQNEIGHED